MLLLVGNSERLVGTNLELKVQLEVGQNTQKSSRHNPWIVGSATSWSEAAEFQ